MIDALKDLVFIDIESTGLNFETCVPWEVSVIDADGAVLFDEMWHPSSYEMADAEPMALAMTNFYERVPSVAPEDSCVHAYDPAAQLARILDKKVLAGAAVAFDMRMLDIFLRNHGQCPTWSHRSVDVQAYAAGAFGEMMPSSLGDTASLAGVEYDKSKKHAALYDAWLAREIYSKCLERNGQNPLEFIKYEDLD